MNLEGRGRADMWTGWWPVSAVALRKVWLGWCHSSTSSASDDTDITVLNDELQILALHHLASPECTNSTVECKISVNTLPYP